MREHPPLHGTSGITGKGSAGDAVAGLLKGAVSVVALPLRLGIGVLRSPRRTTASVATSGPSPERFFLLRMMPLAAVPAVAGVIGKSAVGRPLPGGWVRYGLADALASSVVAYLLTLGGICATGILLALLAPLFGGRRRIGNGITAAGLAATPLFAAGLLLLFPLVSPLMPLGALYGAVILAVAAEILLDVPASKAPLIAAVSLLFACTVWFLLMHLQRWIMGF